MSRTKSTKGKPTVRPIKIPEHRNKEGDLCQQSNTRLTASWFHDAAVQDECRLCERVGFTWLQLAGKVQYDGIF